MVRREPLDPEVLAALLEGTLPARERDEVLERLAQSPDDYEAFVEAASVLRDLDDDDAGAAPVPPQLPPTAPPPREIRPARRRLPGPKLWLPLAAVLAGVLVASQFVLRDGGAATPVALLQRDPLVPSGRLAAALGPGWDQPGWSVRRGGGPSFEEQQRDFRIGVRLAELDAALDAGDAQAVQQVAPQLISLVDEIAPGAGSVSTEYRRIGELAAQRDPRRDPGLEARAAADLADVLGDSPWFGLGIWVEQARLATLARRTELFADPATPELLEELTEAIERQRGAEAPVVRHLRGLRTWIRGGVSRDELEAIRSMLTSVVRESGG